MRKFFSVVIIVVFSGVSYAQSASSISIFDTRAINDSPNFSSHSIRADFKIREVIGVPGHGYFSTNLTLGQWYDNTGDKNHQLNFNNGGIFYRNAYPLDSQWGNWQKIVIANTNGYVGIGNFEPDAPLTVYGVSNFYPIRPVNNGSGDVRCLSIRHSLINSQFLNNLYPLILGTGGGNQPLILDAARVGIGTANPSSMLTVAGDIHSREVKVTVDAGADFVFENDYNLPSLESVDKFIKKNNHLPEIASADEMKKDGINLSEMNIKLLQKIEELTLYSIDQNKKIEAQAKEIEALKDLVLRVSKLESELARK